MVDLSGTEGGGTESKRGGGWLGVDTISNLCSDKEQTMNLCWTDAVIHDTNTIGAWRQR